MAGLWDFVAFVAFRKQKPNKKYLPLHIEPNLVPNLRNIHIRQKLRYIHNTGFNNITVHGRTG